jgi:sugar phosphate isomerase/epimerase
MKKSIQVWYGYDDLSLEDRFRLVKQAGFDAVALRWSDEKPGCDADRQQADLACKLGLQIEYVHAPYCAATHFMADSPAGEESLAKYLSCIETCAGCGVPTMVMHPSCEAVSGVGLERFARMIDLAQRLGLTIALENLRRLPEIVQMTALLEQYDAPCLKVCFDSGHYNAAYEPLPDDVPARFAGRLTVLHLHDNHGLGHAVANCDIDEHLLPFDGDVDWQQTMRRIAAAGYRGPISLESVCRCYPGLAAEEFLAQAFDRAQTLEALFAANIQN